MKSVAIEMYFHIQNYLHILCKMRHGSYVGGKWMQQLRKGELKEADFEQILSHPKNTLNN